MNTLMIYGAAGYTGSMIAEHAAVAGLNIIVAGRASSQPALEALAKRVGADVAIFPLDDAEAVARELADASILLNAAGPFALTAGPLLMGCIRAGVHYLDVSAELDTYRQALALDQEASAAGVMLLPGSGGSVAMLGSLAGHAVARVEQPRRIAIAMAVAGPMSRGSLASANQSVVTQTLRLTGGDLVATPAEAVRDFDFGEGPKTVFPVTLPDLLTLHAATGVSGIDTFVHVGAGAFATESEDGPAGPDAAERAANRYRAAVEVTDAKGRTVRSWLDTVNGYSFTAIAAPEAARRVLAGEVRPGFQTPAGLFGYGFAESIADTCIVDMA